MRSEIDRDRSSRERRSWFVPLSSFPFHPARPAPFRGRERLTRRPTANLPAAMSTSWTAISRPRGSSATCAISPPSRMSPPRHGTTSWPDSSSTNGRPAGSRTCTWPNTTSFSPSPNGSGSRSSRPKSSRWTSRRTATPKTRIPQAPDVGLPYNAYSASGDITAPVVYANSGNPQDYDLLESHGIDLKGKIALVRYSEPYSYRGFKAQTAQKRGLAALLIYSDPQEDGAARGPVFPDGPWGPKSHIQRGGIPFDFIYPGDPLTPGWASVPGAKRLPVEESLTVPKIVERPPLGPGRSAHPPPARRPRGAEGMGGRPAPRLPPRRRRARASTSTSRWTIPSAASPMSSAASGGARSRRRSSSSATTATPGSSAGSTRRAGRPA